MPFELPPEYEPFPPPGGFGPPGQPPPQPPVFGGGGGNPFNATVRGSTPIYGRRLLGGGGGYGSMPSAQFRGQPTAAPMSSGSPASFFRENRQRPAPAAAGPPSGGGQYSPTGQPREWSPYTNREGGFDPKGLVDYLVALGYRSGAFDPEGSRGMHEALRKLLEEQGQGDINRAQLGAQMYAYDDPVTAQYIRANAEQSVRDRTALALAQGDVSSIGRNQDFVRDLLGAYFGVVSRRDPKAGDYAGAALGQLAGAVGGAAAGRIGRRRDEEDD